MTAILVTIDIPAARVTRIEASKLLEHVIVGETEEGWNNFYIISYILIKKSPIPMIFTIQDPLENREKLKPLLVFQLS
jgi:hypothetical protein